MLLTAESTYTCLKTSLGEAVLNFENAIKTLQISITPETNADFSFSLSFAFEIVNKYRIKNNIEGYAEGIKPWILDPVNFFLVSNDTHGITLRKSTQFGLDLTMENYRWDHKLYNIIVGNEKNNKTSIIDSTIKLEDGNSVLETISANALARHMGGDIINIWGFKQLRSMQLNLVSRLTSTSLMIGLVVKGDEISKKKMFRLIPSAPGSYSYPIPEGFMVDANTEHLNVRSAYPTLMVLSKRDSVETAIDMFTESVSLKMKRDVYTLDFLEPRTSHGGSVLTELGLAQHCKYYVCVPHLDRSGEEIFVPFAILSSSLLSSATLTVLPYNFPRLFPLLGLLRTAQQANKPLSNQTTQDLIMYFKSVPIYCQPSLQSVFQLYGLHNYTPAVTPYNKYLVRRLQKMRKSTSDDLVSLETSFRDRICEPFVDINLLALGAVIPLPTSAMEVRPNALLSTWERMRRLVYSRPGLAVQGLSVEGVEGVGGCVGADAGHIDNWISRAVGGSIVNQMTMSAMSRYEERIAVKEALRDPFDQNPPEDENEVSGVLRRKLSVSFGSKYKEAGGKQIDSIQDSIDNIFEDTPAIHRGDDELDLSSSRKSTVSLFSKPLPMTNGKSNHSSYMIGRLTGGTRKRSLVASNADPKSVVADDPPSKMQVGESLALSPLHPISLTIDASEGDNKVIRVKSSNGSCSPTISIPETDSNAPIEDRPPPEGWIKAFSNKQNKTYWYNVNTKKSVWEFPTK